MARTSPSQLHSRLELFQRGRTTAAIRRGGRLALPYPLVVPHVCSQAWRRSSSRIRREAWAHCGDGHRLIDLRARQRASCSTACECCSPSSSNGVAAKVPGGVEAARRGQQAVEHEPARQGGHGRRLLSVRRGGSTATPSAHAHIATRVRRRGTRERILRP